MLSLQRRYCSRSSRTSVLKIGTLNTHTCTHVTLTTHIHSHNIDVCAHAHIHTHIHTHACALACTHTHTQAQSKSSLQTESNKQPSQETKLNENFVIIILQFSIVIHTQRSCRVLNCSGRRLLHPLSPFQPQPLVQHPQCSAGGYHSMWYW